MNRSISKQSKRALTLLEVLMLIAVLTIVAMLFVPLLLREKAKAQRIHCTHNLKQIGLAARVWEGQIVEFPMNVRGTNGGTMEFTTGPNVWRHFQAMSNVLSTPKVLLCPADDSSRVAATNFTFFNNSNISYFIGLEASDSNTESLLSGDRNLTNSTPIRNGILELTRNDPAGWTAEIHKKIGNILLADGSVQQVSITSLRQSVENSGTLTNHLQMPILAP
jgi:hypothetical protein